VGERKKKLRGEKERKKLKGRERNKLRGRKRENANQCHIFFYFHQSLLPLEYKIQLN
jgi:hypothetical protein